MTSRSFLGFVDALVNPVLLGSGIVAGKRRWTGVEVLKSLLATCVVAELGAVAKQSDALIRLLGNAIFASHLHD